MGETTKKEKFLVEGDHPIFKRVYDIFYKKEDALDLIKDMRKFNYENITINGKELNDHESYQTI